ncbi:4Fe-4S dicluster domain-containing protein [Geothrix alkalitolerans]|uniref:4Fe-4S dicluster domain-containing protein n=1 Tax=Geothrix alkalitolerans TaxID=2922724 RepID=UPI001FAF6B25|nr:4Fe-4S dicluster domain-containing protein [Geothrix alkalitolerans]
MAHATLRPGHSAYARFAARLNRFPQGAPPSERLFQILRLLVSEEEAGLLAQVPIRPFTAHRTAAIWKLPEARARAILETLAGRAMLLDWEQDGETRYVMPPPMAGFFEFSMMRVRGDADQAALAELFHQYLNVEEDFLRALFAKGETQLGRVFVDETALPREDALVVLDHERASEVVRTAGAIGIGACYCRHKMAHLGKACDAPMDICMTFGTCADSLTRHQVARRVEAAECLDLLDQARERGLVQFGENVREQVSFICNCCGCCCEAMVAARRFAFMKPVHTTNFLPELDGERCNGCGKCVAACPVEALALVSAHDPHRPTARRARLDEDRCLGCGVCVRTCAPAAIRLRPRKARVLTPANTAHRTVVMALERGKLAELLVDGQSSHGHRAVAAILGAVLKLPPLQRALATKQVKSRYLDRLMAGR